MGGAAVRVFVQPHPPRYNRVTRKLVRVLLAKRSAHVRGGFVGLARLLPAAVLATDRIRPALLVNQARIPVARMNLELPVTPLEEVVRLVHAPDFNVVRLLVRPIARKLREADEAYAPPHR